MTIPNEWGPAILVCFTVLMGMLYNNSRLTDLRVSLNGRIEDIRDVLRAEASKNQSELLGKFAELDHRIEKLEAPRVK